jgi:hypothetical protein
MSKLYKSEGPEGIMGDDAEIIQEPDETYDDIGSDQDQEEPYDSGDSVEPLGRAFSEPDVLLDVPELRVEEVTLDVEDLRAQVSLQALVLDLVKLDVGADVQLGKVHLEIKGVDAQALLKVRLDQVAGIVGRVLTTIDRNPQIVEHVTSGVGTVAHELGRGAGQSVGELGRGAGAAVEGIGQQAGQAVGDIGESAAGVVKEDVGGAVKGVGRPIEGIAETAKGAEQTLHASSRSAEQALDDAGAGERETERKRGPSDRSKRKEFDEYQDEDEGDGDWEDAVERTPPRRTERTARRQRPVERSDDDDFDAVLDEGEDDPYSPRADDGRGRTRSDRRRTGDEAPRRPVRPDREDDHTQGRPRRRPQSARGESPIRRTRS